MFSWPPAMPGSAMPCRWSPRCRAKRPWSGHGRERNPRAGCCLPQVMTLPGRPAISQMVSQRLARFKHPGGAARFTRRPGTFCCRTFCHSASDDGEPSANARANEHRGRPSGIFCITPWRYAAIQGVAMNVLPHPICWIGCYHRRRPATLRQARAAVSASKAVRRCSMPTCPATSAWKSVC